MEGGPMTQNPVWNARGGGEDHEVLVPDFSAQTLKCSHVHRPMHRPVRPHTHACT